MFIHYFRFASDALWQYKILSIITSFILIILTMLYVLRNRSKFKINIVFMFVSLFFFLVTVSLLREINQNSIMIYFKLMVLYFIFIYGSLIDTSILRLNIFSRFCLVSILVIFFVSLLGMGWKVWGSTTTFVGPYFFKTDLAAAVTIFLACYISHTKDNKFFKFFVILISCYLIFITNSRLYYLLFLMIVFIYLFRFKIFQSGVDLRFSFLIVLSSVTFSVVFLTFISTGLGLNFSDGLLSSSNMQGRDQIWTSLLQYFYYDYTIVEKLVGSSLIADKSFSIFWKTEEIHAHSTFIFLLMSTGIVGLLLFMAILFLFIYYLNKGCRTGVITPESAIPFTMAFMVISIGGISNTTIVYVQLSWFFFYFLGVLSQLSVRNNENFNCS